MKLPAASCRASSNLKKVLAVIAVKATLFRDRICKF